MLSNNYKSEIKYRHENDNCNTYNLIPTKHGFSRVYFLQDMNFETYHLIYGYIIFKN